jgi:hypothetical protein
MVWPSHLFPQSIIFHLESNTTQDDGILNSSADIALCYGVNYILAILFFFVTVIAAAIHVVASFASSS